MSYARALQPAKPVGFKVLGARAPALRDWVLPRLTGDGLAGTPSLTTVFGLIERDLRAAQGVVGTLAQSRGPHDVPTPAELESEPESSGPSPSQN